MRNIFDQYAQPENRLTHALATVLDQERSLLVPFLRWLGIQGVPHSRSLSICEQQIPGTLQEDADDTLRKGLPDVTVFDEEVWAVLFECKIQAKVNRSQLERHRATAMRHDFEEPWVVVISVDELPQHLPDRTIGKTWREIYVWFRSHMADSYWGSQMVEYMQTFESKMLEKNYNIRGTITMFDGLRFGKDNPYSYREAKRLIRLLGDLLQKRKDLEAIGVDPTGKGRPKITGSGADPVWDFLPLIAARGAKRFTAFPHLTMSFNSSYAAAAITIPNGVRGGFRRKLTSKGKDGFLELVKNLEERLRPVLRKSRGAKPMIYITQRHFLSQRSKAEVDARLETDLRTLISGGNSNVKFQPEWIESIYNLLVNKHSNIQLGVQVQLKYSCPVVSSPEAATLFAASWIALSPLIDFVMDES